jgi:hypothetical protein
MADKQHQEAARSIAAALLDTDEKVASMTINDILNTIGRAIHLVEDFSGARFTREERVVVEDSVALTIRRPL